MLERVQTQCWKQFKRNVHVCTGETISSPRKQIHGEAGLLA